MTTTSLSQQLLDWFEQHGRHDLPWQQPPSAYRVWVSEIMLQQTQVATVIPYFERFMARFPDLAALAEAPIDEVLAQWSGLGYYARARNLHCAARVCVQQHAAALPEDLDALQALPGVGRSTAGAIYSLAFGQRAPILDGNVKRVLSRVEAIAGWPGKTSVARQLWAAAETHLPQSRCNQHNQALMDLGATVCLPKPSCLICPLNGICKACRQGNPQAYPEPKPRRARPLRETWALLLADDDGAILLQRRPPSGIWGGLWSPPLFEVRDEVDLWLDQRGGVLQSELPGMRHGFTHFELSIRPLAAKLENPESRVMDDADWVWYNGRSAPGGMATPIRRLLQQHGARQRSH